MAKKKATKKKVVKKVKKKVSKKKAVKKKAKKKAKPISSDEGLQPMIDHVEAQDAIELAENSEAQMEIDNGGEDDLLNEDNE